MCDFSGKLVAWTDRELPDDEAADVEQHVPGCSECRTRVDAYREVSRAFVAHCDAAMRETTRLRLPHWVPVLASAAAAAVLLLMFRPTPVKQIPVVSRRADAAPAIVLETAPRPVKKVHRRYAVVPTKPAATVWEATVPAIRIAIPAEAMFPPGAVPEGITFIADVSVAADGSVQGLRLQQ